MSWVAQQPHIIWTLRDGSSSLGMIKGYLPHGATVAAAMSGAAARRSLLVPVTGCVFVRESIIYSSIESAPAAPAPNANVLRAGVLMFATAAPGQLGAVALPGLLPGLLALEGCAAGLDIDTAHPDVMALVAHLLTGAYSNPFGHELTAVIAGYMQERQ